MKNLLYFLFLFIPASAHAVLQPAVQSTSLTLSEPAGFTTMVLSTAACGSTAILVVNSTVSATGVILCNEGVSTVRVGPSTITSSVGLAVFASSCIAMDMPRFFRGDLYCISTSGTQAISTMQGTNP